MVDQIGMVAAAEESSLAEDWATAAARWQSVVAVNPVNGIFWDRLGQARLATGDHAGALAAYRKAAELGVWPLGEPVPSILPGELAYQIARCHAALGDRGSAIEALAGAVRQGLREPGKARDDEHLAPLRTDPRFDDLVGPAGPAEPIGTAGPAGTGSRVERWRADLRFLRSEIARRVPRPDVLDDDFRRAADDLDRDVPELDDAGIVVGIWRLLRRLGDGHAFVVVEQAWPDWTRALPVWFFQFEDGMLVTEAAPRFAHLAGAEVLAIDGRPIAEVIDALDPLLTRDNAYTPLARAAMWLRLPAYLHAVGAADRPDGVTLTVRQADGEVTEVTVPADPPVPAGSWMTARPRSWPHNCPPGSVRPPVTETPAYLRDVDDPFRFEYQPAGNLVYVQFNAVRDKDDETLAAFYPRVFAAVDEHDARALVIDIRWNGGGNTFLAQPLIHHVLAHPHVRVFVITGRTTFSAAQNTATLFDRHTGAVFVGEPTGSAPNFVGETVPFRLPESGILVNVSDLYWQMSWPFDHRIAIAPDIYAPPTAAAYLAGRDPAMDAIRAHLER